MLEAFRGIRNNYLEPLDILNTVGADMFYNLKNRIRHIGSAIDRVQVDIAELKEQIRNKGYPTIY